jgi:hypothetical protein
VPFTMDEYVLRKQTFVLNIHVLLNSSLWLFIVSHETHRIRGKMQGLLVVNCVVQQATVALCCNYVNCVVQQATVALCCNYVNRVVQQATVALCCNYVN